MISFKEYLEEEMGAGAASPGAANAVGHGGVDMNPDGRKRDRRKKWDFNQMFKRASGKYKK